MAQKARLADVMSGSLITVDGAPRVNVVGIVVNAVEDTFILDDQSAITTIRQFDKPMKVPVGEAVVVIGRVRDSAGERYITAEIVKRIDPKWIEVRRKERISIPVKSEQRIEDAPDTASIVMRAIRELDDGRGAAIEKVTEKAGSDAEALIALMLQQGDVFELSPGKIKILE